MIADLSVSEALVYLKQGNKIARDGWNGKGMWLLLIPASIDIKPTLDSPYGKALDGISEIVTIDPHIDMLTASGSMQPGWLASQADLLAYDWCVLP